MTDYISRADAENEICEVIMQEFDVPPTRAYEVSEKILKLLPSADAVDCTEFIEWLVDRVLDETIWENNSVAYGEIICRKLVKIGALATTEKPPYYYVPSADAVDVAHDIPEYCSWSQTYTNMVQSAMADTKSADAEPQTEHDREWIIGCIKHDGFIKTDRFDKANQIILDALSADAVQGEWKAHRVSLDFICSNCGEACWSDFDYCPHCGARMENNNDSD